MCVPACPFVCLRVTSEHNGIKSAADNNTALERTASQSIRLAEEHANIARGRSDLFRWSLCCSPDTCSSWPLLVRALVPHDLCVRALVHHGLCVRALVPHDLCVRALVPHDLCVRALVHHGLCVRALVPHDLCVRASHHHGLCVRALVLHGLYFTEL